MIFQGCACDADGSVDNVCDVHTGECACKEKFSGDKCDEMRPPCDCNPEGSVDNTCHVVTGECVCKDNVIGVNCDMCADGFFNFPACTGGEGGEGIYTKIV